MAVSDHSNVVADDHRSRMRRARLLACWHPSLGPQFIDQQPNEERDTPSAGIMRMLEQSLADPPTRQRQIFVLADLAGVPYPEIARTLGIEAVTVRVTLSRARRNIRRVVVPDRVSAFVDELP